MYINELAEPTLLVIYPGRFQPFHKGHHAVYEYLTGKFGRNNVFIATSNKVDGSKSPFSFAEKAYFMQLTGVPSDRIVQAANPYQIQSILDTSNIRVNPEQTVVIFAVSEKDMAEDPRFSFKSKKDGSAPYFQPLQNIKDTKSMQEHGYIMTVPTFDFTVAGAPMRSGTELRQMYADADEQGRQAIVKDLFGRYTAEAEKLMTEKIAPQAPKEIPRPNKLPKTVKPVGGLEAVTETVSAFVPAKQDTNSGYYKLLAHRYRKDPRSLSNKEKEELHNYIIKQQVFKECAGVGVVKGGNDPRYMTATMGDQNDVDGNTLNKEMVAYGLVGRKSPGGKTRQKSVKGNVGQGVK
jgi:hypothetical protein